MRGALLSRLGAVALLAACAAAPAVAEVTNPANPVAQPIDSKGNILGAGKQESFALVSANVAASAGTVFGGDYIFGQICTGYGTITLQVQGPDNSTFETIVSKTSADSTGGTGVALGSGAVVKATITGTTGCNALLTRVP